MAKAKKQSSSSENPKKRTFAARRAHRAKTNPAPSSPRKNPPFFTDLTHVILPGFGAYAATRILQRIVYTTVQKRWPRFGRYAHAAAGVVSFGSVWWFGHKVKQLAPYHDTIVMGSGVAAVQGIGQALLPAKYSWLLADCTPADVAPAQPQILTAPAPNSSVATSDDEDEYSYLEQQLEQMERSGAKSARAVAPGNGKRGVAATLDLATAGQNDGAAIDPDLMDELEPGEDIDSLYSGAFQN